MKRYVVTLEKVERDKLAGITRKGSHQSQKVINALILLNCDEGEFNEHRARGGPSRRGRYRAPPLADPSVRD